jgi:hypothetical protein
MLLAALLLTLFGRARAPFPRGPLLSSLPPTRPAPLPDHFHGPLELTGESLWLVPRGSYLIKMVLTGMTAALSNASSLHAKVAEMGFQPARVWNGHPPDLFPDRELTAGASTYWVAGVYAGAPQTPKRPPGFTRVWLLPLPPAEAPASSPEPEPAGATFPAMTPASPEAYARLVELQGLAYLVRKEIAALQGPEPPEREPALEETFTFVSPADVPAHLNGDPRGKRRTSPKPLLVVDAPPGEEG